MFRSTDAINHMTSMHSHMTLIQFPNLSHQINTISMWQSVFKKVTTFNIGLYHVAVIEHTRVHLGHGIVISHAKQWE